MRCIQCTTRLVSRGKICTTCASRNWREKNPMMYAYSNLKGHAKARGKEFSLTFEEFSEFAIRVDYIANKGRSSTSYHVDRIREEEGYHVGNIQKLTNSENVKKYRMWRDPNQADSSFFSSIWRPSEFNEDDCPF